MKISTVFLAYLLTFVLNLETKDQEEDLKSDTYVAPSGVTCLKCFPGTFLHSHCVSENTTSRCQQCSNGTFSSDKTIAKYCDNCTKHCATHELVPVRNCTHKSDLICGCPNGKFNLYPTSKKHHAVCQEFGPCQPGYGVLAKGTSVENTTCVRCVAGKTFSSTTSAYDECQQCTKCDPRDIPTECTLTQDRKCNQIGSSTVCNLKTQTSTNSLGSSFTAIMQKVVYDLITNGSWEFFIRDLYQVSNNTINADTKIREVQLDFRNAAREQIYQCLTFICERGATHEKLIETLQRKECHSFVATLRKDLPDAFQC